MYVGESEVGCVNVGRSVAFHPVGVGEVANNTVAFHPVGVGEVANNTVASHPVGLGEVADNTVASYPVGLEACSHEGPVVEVYVSSAASGVSSKDPASTQHGGVFGFRHGRDALPTDEALFFQSRIRRSFPLSLGIQRSLPRSLRVQRRSLWSLRWRSRGCR